MRKFLLATSTLAGLVMAAPAGAADMPVKARPLPPPLPRCANFQGFYIGGSVGAGFYQHSADDRDAFVRQIIGESDVLSGTFRQSKSGGVYGVQGGYNWQWGCTVFGIEADYMWSKITNSGFNTDGEHSRDLDQISFSSQLKGIGTIRARGGVVVDNALLYVTAGVAGAKFNREITGRDFNSSSHVATFQSSRTRWGWVAGFGIEYALAGLGKGPLGGYGGGYGSNWSIKWETLFHQFQTDEQTFTCGTRLCGRNPNDVRFAFDDQVWTTKIGLNYRFDFGKAPVRAAY